MEEVKVPFKTTLNYAVIVGLIFIVIETIFMLGGVEPQHWSQYLKIPVAILVFFMVMQRIRDNEMGGYASFGKIFVQGMLVAVFGGVLVGVFMYVYLGYIDDSMVDAAMDQAYEQMASQGMSDREIETAMSMTEAWMSPGMMAFYSFFGSAIGGTLYSLIAAIFVKKEQPV
jgi:hypothetical protein